MKLSAARAATATGLTALVLLAPGLTGAATPAADSIGPGDPATTWTGPDRNAETSGPDACAEMTGLVFGPYCDDFNFTVTAQGRVEVAIDGTVPANDFDLYVYDRNGTLVGSSAFVGGIEATEIDCATPALSPYLVRTVYFQTFATPVDGDPGYTGHATWTADTSGCAATAPQATFSGSLAFGPSTIVSAHFLGSEPQTTLERGLPGHEQATDPNRIFVDWPLSSRSAIGQLNRSLDGGDSFRLLLDLTCAPRSRPNCATGGGGDTENEVNLHSGTVLFSDQEVVANEAFAASFDHGDTFISQTPVSNPTTATDRQWLTATDASYGIGPGTIEGFLAYHVPCAGQYVQGIAHLGAVAEPIPQATPQLFNVGQSGQPRVDNNAGSPGYRWIYQPYSTCIGGGIVGRPAGALSVATASGPSYANPLAWKTHLVDESAPDIFSWTAVDAAGNAYIVWTSVGVLYLSASPIHDPRNDPSQGGWPGSYWTPKVRVQLPEVGSAVFPEVIAGDPGRIGVTYDGTTQCTGLPDDCGPTTEWNAYAAVISNALGVGGPPVVATGRVSHRVIHMGNVCTSGASCAEPFDRSLLDMTDLGFDQTGRLGVVYTDNRTDSFHERPGGEDEQPFVHFAKQVAGTSVLANTVVAVPVPAASCRPDAAGDAFWPNRALTLPGANLPALDERQACLELDGRKLVAEIVLGDASAAAMQRDLVAYNAQSQPCAPPCEGKRLQYVVRFLTANEIYHLSMEFLPGGTLRFFGGRLDANDKILNPGNPTSSGVIAAGYHTDSAYPVTGEIKGDRIVLRAPAASFGLATGSQLYSVTAFATAGPLEHEETLASYVMRTVDATPPFDAVLGAKAGTPKCEKKDGKDKDKNKPCKDR